MPPRSRRRVVPRPRNQKNHKNCVVSPALAYDASRVFSVASLLSYLLRPSSVAAFAILSSRARSVRSFYHSKTRCTIFDVVPEAPRST